MNIQGDWKLTPYFKIHMIYFLTIIFLQEMNYKNFKINSYFSIILYIKVYIRKKEINLPFNLQFNNNNNNNNSVESECTLKPVIISEE